MIRRTKRLEFQENFDNIFEHASSALCELSGCNCQIQQPLHWLAEVIAVVCRSADDSDSNRAIDSLAKLIPPPRRHRYHGVLSANSKYRSEVTRFANKPFTPEDSKSYACGE